VSVEDSGMDIASGLGALKSGFDIANAINQRVKEGKLYPNEIAEQLLHLQQAMLDSQRALNDASDEIKSLRTELEKRNELEADKKWEPDGSFYRRKSDVEAGRDIPYCPLCWETSSRAVPLNPQNIGRYECALHQTYYSTSKWDDEVRRVRAMQGQASYDPLSWMR
jgi:hypothetical protein